MLSPKFKLPSWLDEVIVHDQIPVLSPFLKNFQMLHSVHTSNIFFQKWCNHNLCTPKLYTKSLNLQYYHFLRVHQKKNQAISFEKTGEKQKL